MARIFGSKRMQIQISGKYSILNIDEETDQVINTIKTQILEIFLNQIERLLFVVPFFNDVI